MIALRSLSGLSRLFQPSLTDICPSILEAEEFQRLLQRERRRADRNGETFSLIIMTPRNSQHGKTLLPVLTRVLRSRLRATDDVGRIDEHRLGALLPDTPSAGAWTVVDHVVHLLPKDVLSPICEVYTYPSFDEGDEELAGGSNDRELEGVPVGEGNTPGGNGAPRDVRRMETLFVISQPAWKRGMDILGALVGLALLSPLLAAVAIAVKLTSPGPVFFRQLRCGQGGEAFTLYKFRSMVDGAEAMQHTLRCRNEQDGPAFKIKADPRITPLGKFLRRTGLDEFPQLWNVLMGDMTLVGPRPLPCHESDASETWQRRRLDAKPGLTCIWQSRGHEKVSFAEWMRMDMRYLERQNLSLDASLIAKTVLMAVRCKASG
jgi:lipopolysaccharide/colanic/teichoic acid biosynthesis glycosyltransferase